MASGCGGAVCPFWAIAGRGICSENSGQLVGVEAETRVRDIQAFVRRVRGRQLEGGTDTIVIVLAESAHNRRVLPQLLEALGPRYSTSARVLLKALREGKPLAGSGVVLI